jgi:hypothetical protein
MFAAGTDKTKEKIMRREGCVFTKGDVDALVPEGKSRAKNSVKNYMSAEFGVLHFLVRYKRSPRRRSI